MRATMRRRWAILLVLGLLAAACAQGTTEDTTAETTADAPATTEAMDDTATTEAMDDTATTEAMAGDVQFDGTTVTEDTIYVGMLADQTGTFSSLVNDIVDAELAFFDEYNAAGGVDGQWQIEALVEDTGYNVEQHGQKYQELKDQVVAITQSTGSPHTASILEQLTADGLFTIPLSWYSGWSDPATGVNTLEQGVSYCLEGMNIIEYQAEKFEAENGRPMTVAVVTFPGEYGQDSATGAKHAITELGLELVYDGEGKVIPPSADNANPDQSEVITGIVNNQPDLVFITVSPPVLASIFGGTLLQGYQGLWSGAGPSFNFRLLDTEIGEALAASYTQSTYYAPYGSDVAGMDELEATLKAAFGDRVYSDAYTRGWIEYRLMTTVLEEAAANGDLTREGVLAAAISIPSFDFAGIAPAQTYAGDVNDYLARESMFLEVDYEAYVAGGGSAATVQDDFDFYDIVQDWTAGDIAAAYEYTGPCWTG